MNGQWVGHFDVTYPDGVVGPGGGTIVLDLDELSDCFAGIAHVDLR